MNPLEALEITPGASNGEAGALFHRLAEVCGMPGEQGRRTEIGRCISGARVPSGLAGRGLDRFDVLIGRLFKRG
jgi:hypothetical protein